MSETSTELAVLLARLSYKKGRFRLASGRTSDFYIDVRQTVMTPEGAGLIGRLLLDRIEADIENQIGLADEITEEFVAGHIQVTANIAWSSGNTPLAMGETITGVPVVSANRTRASLALARAADMPAMIKGRRAPRSHAATSGLTPVAANRATPPLVPVVGGRMMASSDASASTTLAGVVRCTGPGRSAAARLKARRMIPPTLPGSTFAVHLLTGENIRLWSIT